MLDLILNKKSAAVKISVKGALTVFCIALAVALPQITHALGGAQAGVKYMPMYAPALLAGCFLGWQYGLLVGALSPVVSFGITQLALGSAMPAAERLPYMALELAAYGVICGLFSKKIAKTPALAFPVVALAQVSGRAVYVVYNLIAGKSFTYLFNSIVSGLPGLYIQLLAVPAIVMLLGAVIKRADRS